MKKVLIVTAVLLLVALLSCEKAGEPVEGSVDIYLLEDFREGSGDLLINQASVTLSEDPVISYDEIISYNPDTYALKLSDIAKESIFEADPSVYGEAFAVVVDGEIIYTGFFWPGYYSAMLLWVYIDPLTLWKGNTVMIDIGYPGLPESAEVPDLRNDERLLNIFKRDGKLK